MKPVNNRIILVLLLILFGTHDQVLAQSPKRISYQAVIRDVYGILLADTNISTQITILQGKEQHAVYTEIQYAATNSNGLVSYEIGNGVIVFGSFNAIDWSNGPTYIKMETDPNGGTDYSISGTTEFLSVPYALYAANSQTFIAPGDNVTVSGNGSETSPYIISANTSTSNSGNLEISNLDLNNNNQLIISSGDSSIETDLSKLDDSEAIASVASDFQESIFRVGALITSKEDVANKDTDPALAANSDDAYPSQRAVKTYIDTQIGNIVEDDDISDASLDATNMLTINEGDSAVSVDLSALDNSLAIEALQSVVEANELANTNAISSLQSTIESNQETTTTTLELKEEVSNKDTDGTLSANSDEAYPSQQAVKTYVDNQIIANSTPDATADEKGKIQLTGDLSGSAEAPEVANQAITPLKIAPGSANQILKTNDEGTSVVWIDEPVRGIAKFYNSKAQRVNDKDGKKINKVVAFNTTSANMLESHVSLENNTITLQPGTYELIGSIGAFRNTDPSNSEAFYGFYNRTTKKYIGQGGYVSNGNGPQTKGSPYNAANCVITVTEPTLIQLRINRANDLNRISHRGGFNKAILGRAWVRIVKY